MGVGVDMALGRRGCRCGYARGRARVYVVVVVVCVCGVGGYVCGGTRGV